MWDLTTFGFELRHKPVKSKRGRVVGQVAGLRYETVHQPAGPSGAERKLEELTRQLEVEMRLSPSPSTRSLSPSQQSAAITSHGHSLPGRLQRAKHHKDTECPPSCSMCLAWFICSVQIICSFLRCYVLKMLSVLALTLLIRHQEEHPACKKL